MKPEDCPDRETLERHLLGSISKGERETLREHLLHCEECASKVSAVNVREVVTEAIRPGSVSKDEDLVVEVIDHANELRSQAETAKTGETIIFVQAKGQAAQDPKLDNAALAEDVDFLDPPEQSDEIGRLGEYRVLEVMGVGGMGVVFRAEDPKLKRQVALKVMKPAIAASKSARDRFLREAQATAAIEHHNIVHIYQVGEARSIPFIAMQLLRGESLQKRLEREVKLDQRDLIQIGREVADGLAAAHEHGLIHRDIKPDNIWLEQQTGWAKILDFGLARTHDEDAGLTQAGTILGTPKYMSPEQAEGGSVDHRCDLFSLGSVLYHLASGKTPFDGNNVTSTLIAVSQANCRPVEELRPNLRPELAKLIAELLSKDRDARPHSAAEVGSVLAEIEKRLEYEPSQPAETTAISQTPVPAGKFIARKPVLLAGIAIAFALVMFFILWATGLIFKVETESGTAPGDKNDTLSSEDKIAGDAVLQKKWHASAKDAPPAALAPFAFEQAQQHQRAWASSLGAQVEQVFDLPDGEKLTMVLIPPGEFLMGAAKQEQDLFINDAKIVRDLWSISRIPNEGPQHRVRINRPFCLGKYEVTQAQWQAVMGDNPSSFRYPSGPVEQIGWDDVQLFLAKVNQTSGKVGMRFALPTQAQWEFACRAGSTTFWHCGNEQSELEEYAWLPENSELKTHPVGQLRPNGFGLHDMHGNVWEWCADWYEPDYYENSPVNDPTGPVAGSRRLFRGGSWKRQARLHRSAYRYDYEPNLVSDALGFRLALVVVEE